jgi:hypothetical protein
MDERQQQELGDWGERLAMASDGQQRAMGRAISMLLAHIEALQAELDAASTPVTHHQPGAEHRQGSTPTVAEADPPDGDGYEWDRHLVESPTDDAGTGENTSETGLRGRVRRAARHLRAENRS